MLHAENIINQRFSCEYLNRASEWMILNRTVVPTIEILKEIFKKIEFYLGSFIFSYETATKLHGIFSYYFS